MSVVEIRHFHLFCGLGGGARGFNRGSARVGQLQASFRCVGGVDCDPAAIEDFSKAAGVRGTVLDLFTREQYIAWHGHAPPEGWREATPDDIRRAAGYERPNCSLLSPPCKGFSGLMAESKSRTAKYVALNELTVRGVWLMLEAWADDPCEFYCIENVPRILSARGRILLDQIVRLLNVYGYVCNETVHDCGELGGLAQRRKRFLLVARHAAKVPNFLYEPRTRPLRAVGDVLGRLPVPVGSYGTGLHRVPNLEWKTWVRLAFVEAGKDWRSLNRLRVEGGELAEYGLAPETGYYRGAYGVQHWQGSSGTVTGNGRPGAGAFAVADPRFDAGNYECGQYGVLDWSQTSGALINVKSPGQGHFSVSDPRPLTASGSQNVYRVVRVEEPGSPAALLPVADPRPGQLLRKGKGSAYLTAGNFGVRPWAEPSYAVTGHGQHDNGYHSVADPRLPAGDERLACIIVAEDETWHRPFTTLELAALQSLLDLDEWEHWNLHGDSEGDKRERIGNAIPGEAAAAIAGVIGQTLLLAWSGQTFALSSEPIWVRQHIAALQCGTALAA